MFSKKELKILNEIIPDKSFMKTKAGIDAARQGIEDANNTAKSSGLGVSDTERRLLFKHRLLKILETPEAGKAMSKGFDDAYGGDPLEFRLDSISNSLLGINKKLSELIKVLSI